MAVHVHRADGDDALHAHTRRERSQRVRLRGRSAAGEAVDQDVGPPALDRPALVEELLARPVQVLDPCRVGGLVRAGMSHRDRVSPRQEVRDRRQADGAGPADEQDAH
jgi:hypothetical protein